MLNSSMVYSIVCKQQLLDHNLQRCRPRGYKNEKGLRTKSAKFSKRSTADSGASSDKDRPTIITKCIIYVYIYIYIHVFVYLYFECIAIISVCMCVYTYVNVLHRCTSLSLYIYIYTCKYICIYIYICKQFTPCDVCLPDLRSTAPATEPLGQAAMGCLARPQSRT